MYGSGPSSLLQHSSNKRKGKGGNHKTDEMFSEIEEWETKSGYINPLIECRLVVR